MRCCLAALAVFVVSLAAPRLVRSETTVSALRQAAILGRVLAYDRAMKERAGDSVLLTVLYRGGNAASEACSSRMFEAFRSMEKFALFGLPFQANRLAYGVDSWREAARSGGVDAVYVCDGLDNDIDAIAAVTRERKITTMGAREDYVTRALSLGVFASEDKPIIVLNHAASREEGAAFSSDLLRLAKVINAPQ